MALRIGVRLPVSQPRQKNLIFLSCFWNHKNSYSGYLSVLYENFQHCIYWYKSIRSEYLTDADVIQTDLNSLAHSQNYYKNSTAKCCHKYQEKNWENIKYSRSSIVSYKDSLKTRKTSFSGHFENNRLNNKNYPGALSSNSIVVQPSSSLAYVVQNCFYSTTSWPLQKTQAILTNHKLSAAMPHCKFFCAGTAVRVYKYGHLYGFCLSAASTQKRKYAIKRKNYKFPELKDEDLEEMFVRGSGPGGQSVNKTANCVVLKHKPSGIVVKCHESRSLEDNKKRARMKLEEKLDLELYGDQGYIGQVRAEANEERNEKKRRAKKRLTLKKAFKEREGLD